MLNNANICNNLNAFSLYSFPNNKRRYFDNKIQHFNRIQRPEWLYLFNSVGLELVEEFLWTEDIGTIKVDKKYEKLRKKDIECTILKIIHRKPG